MLLRHAGFRMLCQARDLLREPSDEGAPSVAAIATMVGISRAHFIRQFEALFGVTPHQYRMQARLDHARELLTASEQSVTDVCLTVGFSSLGSFSTLFTRRVGESPSDYRRRVRVQGALPGSYTRLVRPGCLTLLANLPVGSHFSRSAPTVRSGTLAASRFTRR